MRDKQVSVRFTNDEMEKVHERMAQAGTDNRENFMRRMILEGNIQPVDMKEIKKLNIPLSDYIVNTTKTITYPNFSYTYAE